MSNARAQVEELIVEQVSELLEPLTLARSSSPSALELMGVASSEDRAEDQDISEWIGLVLDVVVLMIQMVAG